MKFVKTCFPLLLLVLFAASCSNDPEQAATETVTAEDDWAPVSDTAGGPAREFADPEALTHPQGRFRVRWPANCVGVRTRLEESEAGSGPGQYEMVSATGIVDGAPACGYTVWAFFNESDGTAATAETVTRRMAFVIGHRDLTIVEQGPIIRLGMEGVVAYCREEQTGLVFWVEAYLSKGRTLLVAAWERGDFMFEDPEILRFFRSVEFVD